MCAMIVVYILPAMDVPDSARTGDARQIPAEDLETAQELLWRLTIVNHESMAFLAEMARIAKLKERSHNDNDRMRVLPGMAADSHFEWHRIIRILKERFGIALPETTAVTRV